MSEQTPSPFAIDLIYPAPTPPRRIFDLTSAEKAFFDQMLTNRLPPPPPVVVPPPPPANQIGVNAASDWTAALAAMADGKVLVLARGIVVPSVIDWKWSNASLRIADSVGPVPVIRGIRLIAGCANVQIDGLRIEADGGYGVDWRAAQTKQVSFSNLWVNNCQNGFSIHTPNHEKQPIELWHKNLTISNCRVTKSRPQRPNDQMDTTGQGWYLAEIDGLIVDGCHADDCGGMNPANPRRHGFYVSQFLNNYILRNCAGTRCSSYAIQARSEGGIIDACAAYDCGMGIMLNAAIGTVMNSAVVRGHPHSQGPWGSYGKGGFDLHMGAGVIENNIVTDGPTKMPAGFYQEKAFNLWYRETKRDDKGNVTNQAWEWIKMFQNGTQRPLAKLGANNVDRSDRIVSENVDQLLALQPKDVAAKIIADAKSL